MVLRLHGGQTIEASCDAVWLALHDVVPVGQSLPGCLSLRRVSPTRYEVSVLLSLGPVSIPFTGVVEALGDATRQRLRLQGFGDAGLAGRAEGVADLVLRPSRRGCYLTYRVEAEPSGPFVALGTLLLSGIARELATRFAARFAENVMTTARMGEMNKSKVSTPLRRPA